MPAEEYRVADLELFPAGPDLTLVYSRDTGAAAFYRPDVVELLSSLRTFRTLDEHLRHYLADRPGGAASRDLVRLSRAGFLIRRDEPLAGPDGAPPRPISTVGFPTRDRVDSLRRAVTGYAENCLRYGRGVEFVVLDDSPEPAAVHRCRTMLAELSRRLGARISHAGPAERAGFAAVLAEAGRIPVEVARYGCLGEPDPGQPAAATTVGANRNSLLLHAAGERLFSADDDTVCRLAAAPRQSRQPRVLAGADPLETWFFADRSAAFGAVADVEQDLLGLHEEFLGRTPAAVLAAGGGLPEPDELPPSLLRRLRARPGRILLTGNGTAGDCGWDNPYFALFAQGDSFARLTESAAGYRQAGASRDVVQAVRRPTVTEHPQPRLAICLGLDNTELLAPFPPTGRAEEVAFGSLLARCHRDGYGAQLPWLVRHDPEEKRQFSARPPFLIELGSWLPACIDRYDPGTVTDPAGRLAGLGSYLGSLGRWPAEQFDEFVRFTVWQSMTALIDRLAERLDGAEPPPAYWAADARRFIAAVRRQALAPVTELYPQVAGRAGLQRSLVRFGELLCWWPQLVTAAAELRADGRRLAVPVVE